MFLFLGDLGQSDENVEHLCWGTGDNSDVLSYKDTIVGRVIGGPDGYSRSKDEDDEQEPLALLVIHAAMHMLFLPQFTCEFFEENNDADLDADFHDDSMSSSSENMSPRGARNKSESAPVRRGTNSEDEEEDLTDEQREAKELARQDEEEQDFFMKKEAGLKETRYVDSGILLLPRPTTTVWAGGIGVKPNKVSNSLLFLVILQSAFSNTSQRIQIITACYHKGK